MKKEKGWCGEREREKRKGQRSIESEGDAGKRRKKEKKGKERCKDRERCAEREMKRNVKKEKEGGVEKERKR